MAAMPPFSPALFTFLRELRKNNDRGWFQDQKARYETVVKGPALHFIAAFQKPLAKISPHLVADPRPVGGSLFRIHRDVRFGKDKSPYKTHVGIHFRHEAGKDAHAPGLYLHLEPRDVWIAAGIWGPDGPALARIRDAIVDDPAGWKRVSRGKGFTDTWSLGGSSLKRPPRGYDAEHPMIEDLKRKSFVATTGFTERDACAAEFPARLAKAWKRSTPLLRFLTRTQELPF
jgi:uncharacterized protein (TIGR02453 family)